MKNPRNVNPYDINEVKRIIKKDRDRPNPRSVNPYDSKAYKRVKK